MFTSVYAPHLLKPVQTDGAEAHNAALLGPTALGVEVTEAALARRCGLGNIDPQHGFGQGRGRAAIEAAIDWPLPPRGSRLVTIRPDADALGAMAVLELRANGVPLSAYAHERIDLIARHDSFKEGVWNDFVAARGPLQAPVSPAEVSLVPLIYAGVSVLASDRTATPSARVASTAAWLMSGRLPTAALRAAKTAREALAEAYNGGVVTVTRRSAGGTARVIGRQPGALALGYRLAPVVVAAANETSPTYVTIAQFAPGYARLGAIAAALARREPGWGGSATIIGSPQGVGTRIPIEEIEVIVEKHLTRDAALAAPPQLMVNESGGRT